MSVLTLSALLPMSEAIELPGEGRVESSIPGSDHTDLLSQSLLSVSSREQVSLRAVQLTLTSCLPLMVRDMFGLGLEMVFV